MQASCSERLLFFITNLLQGTVREGESLQPDKTGDSHMSALFRPPVQYLTVKAPVIERHNYLLSFHRRNSSLESALYFSIFLLPVFPSEPMLDNLF